MLCWSTVGLDFGNKWAWKPPWRIDSHSSESRRMNMSAPLLLRAVPFLRLRYYRLVAPVLTCARRPFFSTTELSRSDADVSYEDKSTTVLGSKVPPNYPKWDDPDFRKWKVREGEILRDIEPITSLVKEILHSGRYMDGERLNAEDENAVVDKLLAFHPHSEDKIGCGLDCIMVDRHPQFRRSRCLFVVRTDGRWIDFSYQKCLRAYVREKYPSHADRFIREHFKRGSG